MTKYVFLDGARIDSPRELHETFAASLELPDYFGRNMDALHDCLTDIFEPVTVIAVNAELLREHLGRSANAFRRLMADLCEEKEGFRFLEEPFDDA
ncbi:MAG: barstar family protein [Clostridia bacterium]|nr:barstar family protein [Clostridia bacterium]